MGKKKRYDFVLRASCSNFVAENKITMMKRILLILTLVVILTGCKGGAGKVTHDDSRHAQLLTMTQKKGFLQVDIQDPWHGGQVLHTYLLVPRDSAMPAQLPQGTVVRTPIENALVYSEVHASLMRELGGFAAVKGVTDVNFYTDAQVLRLVKAGKIADCGNSMSPTIEKVIAMKPDAILLSPFQDATYGQIEKLNIPIIECADYLEFTPLGRAEWMRFYGALLGRQDTADSLYTAVKDRYNDIKVKISTSKMRHPSVLTEMIISGIWAVPGGNSYMAKVIADAGGSYPWSSDKSTGSLSLDFNQVLAKAQNVDFWFIKWTGINTLADLQGQYDLNRNFSAFKKKNVWVCDTEKSHFFVRVPFHPDVLLQEFAAALHPHLFPGYNFTFYHRLTR